MRSIKIIHKTTYSPIGDLKTHSPLPSAALRQIDPFILLNHHGPQIYSPNNNGLPFGPHPHRGMETVTFVIDGEIMHKDSGGHESIIKSGGVQWMTAGKGLIHAEVSPEEFKRKGGRLEILQLWLNLPAKFKMVTPYYHGLQNDKIPTIQVNNKVELKLILGSWENYEGAFNSLTGTMLSTVHSKSSGIFEIMVPVEHNIFCYVIKGKANVNTQLVKAFQLVEFNNDDALVIIEANEDTLLIFGQAKPLQEPMVVQGPFVMNTQEEIQEAYKDYQDGKFGKWGY
jgi:redox-sensitive bicupin YhaK (pirin superfamily)